MADDLGSQHGRSHAVEIARGPRLPVGRARKRAHDHVRDASGLQHRDDRSEQTARFVVDHGASSGSAGHARRNSSSPTSTRYSAIRA